MYNYGSFVCLFILVFLVDETTELNENLTDEVALIRQSRVWLSPYPFLLHGKNINFVRGNNNRKIFIAQFITHVLYYGWVINWVIKYDRRLE